MTRIVVDPERLRSLSVRFNREASNISSVDQRVHSAVGRLQWEVRQKANIEGALQSVKGQGDGLGNKAQELSQYLNRKADLFVEADTAYQGDSARGGQLDAQQPYDNKILDYFGSDEFQRFNNIFQGVSDAYGPAEIIYYLAKYGVDGFKGIPAIGIAVTLTAGGIDLFARWGSDYNIYGSNPVKMQTAMTISAFEESWIVYNELGGEIAGQVIGSYICPGFGTVAGGVIGGMVGDWWGNTTVDLFDEHVKHPAIDFIYDQEVKVIDGVLGVDTSKWPNPTYRPAVRGIGSW